MARKAKLGRPPSGKKHRKEQIVAYVTETDARKMTKLAHDLGFPSRSKLISGIFESLILGGFSTLSFLQVAIKIRKLAQENKLDLKAGYYFANRPMPALEVEDIPDGELEEIFNNIKQENKC